MFYVNDFLTEILKVFYDENLSLDYPKMSRYERQIHSLNIIKFEVNEFVSTMDKKTSELAQKSLLFIRESIDREVMLMNFVVKYKNMLKLIEMERRDFCLMLKKTVWRNSKRSFVQCGNRCLIWVNSSLSGS